MSLTELGTIIGITGVIGGAVGGVTVQWFRFWQQRKGQQIEGRRQRVSEWREMVAEVAQKFDAMEDKNEVKISRLLKRHKAFYSLQPYLTREALDQLFSDAPFTIAVRIGGPISPRLDVLVDEIARIERVWKLV